MNIDEIRIFPVSYTMVRESFRNSMPNLESASNLAIEALAQLASDPEKMSGFLALSGIGPENLRVAAKSPGFLQGVLDYICSDEALLREVAAANGRTPEQLDRARQMLAGPQPDWGA